MSASSPLKLIVTLCDELFRCYGWRPQIGCELEFYIIDTHGNLVDDVQAVPLMQSLQEQGICMEKERGRGQFEIQTAYTHDLIGLVEEINNLKLTLQRSAQSLSFMVNFDAKPYPDDYGSSLHTHLNFIDVFQKNIFADGSIDNNAFLKKVIFGILDLVCEGIYFFSKADNFSRFGAQFMAPMNISWGGNNRTTAIRIPDSISQYRRIEFRLPSADDSLDKVISFMLIGALHGLAHHNLSYERIYGNAYDEHYALQLLPQGIKEAGMIFHERGILKNYLRNFHFIKV